MHALYCFDKMNKLKLTFHYESKVCYSHKIVQNKRNIEIYAREYIELVKTLLFNYFMER